LQRSVNEIDAFAVAQAGVFLIELKSRGGIVTGTRHVWDWSKEGQIITVDRPLTLANSRAAKLAVLLRKKRHYVETAADAVVGLIGAKWKMFILYRETADLAKELIDQSCQQQKIAPGQLTTHADRGATMTSKSLALFLADLAWSILTAVPCFRRQPVFRSHFKTLNRPQYPDRFGSIHDAGCFCQEFFPWYVHRHHHSGLHLLTPATVLYGLAAH
jgi:hypothetical protein